MIHKPDKNAQKIYLTSWQLYTAAQPLLPRTMDHDEFSPLVRCADFRVLNTGKKLKGYDIDTLANKVSLWQPRLPNQKRAKQALKVVLSAYQNGIPVEEAIQTYQEGIKQRVPAEQVLDDISHVGGGLKKNYILNEVFANFLNVENREAVPYAKNNGIPVHKDTMGRQVLGIESILGHAQNLVETSSHIRGYNLGINLVGRISGHEEAEKVKNESPFVPSPR